MLGGRDLRLRAAREGGLREVAPDEDREEDGDGDGDGDAMEEAGGREGAAGIAGAMGMKGADAGAGADAGVGVGVGVGGRSDDSDEWESRGGAIGGEGEMVGAGEGEIEEGAVDEGRDSVGAAGTRVVPEGEEEEEEANRLPSSLASRASSSCIRFLCLSSSSC